MKYPGMSLLTIRNPWQSMKMPYIPATKAMPMMKWGTNKLTSIAIDSPQTNERNKMTKKIPKPLRLAIRFTSKLDMRAITAVATIELKNKDSWKWTGYISLLPTSFSKMARSIMKKGITAIDMKTKKASTKNKRDVLEMMSLFL